LFPSLALHGIWVTFAVQLLMFIFNPRI
jgi:hypothetical protein